MRILLAASLILAASACNAKPNDRSDHKPGTVWTVVAGQLVTLTASDGVKVFGAFEQAEHPKALILLFHQAGSSKDEYATLTPWLAQNGYSSLAIDQRSGGGLYGDNLTVHELGKSADYLEAQKDLKAALDWGRKPEAPDHPLGEQLLVVADLPARRQRSTRDRGPAVFLSRRIFRQ